MSAAHISQVMYNFLHRGMGLNGETLTQCSEKFFHAPSKPSAVNLMAYVLNQIPDDAIESFEMLHRPDLLTDRKLYDRLAKVVNEMPTLEFQFVPLVMMYKGELDTSFVLRVRKQTNSAACVFFDQTVRKYDTFSQFLDSNRLPESVLWFPRDGQLRYQSEWPTPVIDIDRREIKRTDTVWKKVAIAGSGVAMILAFTPLGVTVTAPLIFISNLPTLGFTIADLIDGVQHERTSVVVQRSAALGFCLITFASSGLTSVCRVQKLRRLVPAGILDKLVKAEQILAATQLTTSGLDLTMAVIGEVNGWQKIPTAMWVKMGVLLCYAYRETFGEETAKCLIGMIQREGVVKFFTGLFPYVVRDKLKAMVNGSGFANLLQLVVQFLQQGIEFRVDDHFTTITLFGYKLKFQKLLAINWELMQSLLLQMQNAVGVVGKLCMEMRTSEKWSPSMLSDVMELLVLVNSLKDIPCTLADYIIIGKGYRYTIATVRAFFTTDKLARIDLLRALNSLTEPETKQLNDLRLEPGRLEGDDESLFSWLANHDSGQYTTALKALAAVAAATATTEPEKGQPTRIKLVNRCIGIGSLRLYLPAEILKVPEGLRTELFQHERFQRLCHQVNVQLLERANSVWLKTWANTQAGPTRALETISLLEQLFKRFPNRAGLARALNYALQFDNATVELVYYVILFTWNDTTNDHHLKQQTMQSRFGELVQQAHALRMARYISCPPSTEDGGSEHAIIALARTALPVEHEDDEVHSIPFGSAERAACWLHLMPALRNATTRAQIKSVLRNLLQHGSATVMQRSDPTVQQLPTAARMVLFVLAENKIVVEMLPPGKPGDGCWLLSFYLCGSSIGSAAA
uniref:DUF4781 domain-containing protein n=1 Tax=Anopheles farauti TaxID=69004 RepID=A0A182Q8B1_9DIPT